MLNRFLVQQEARRAWSFLKARPWSQRVLHVTWAACAAVLVPALITIAVAGQAAGRAGPAVHRSPARAARTSPPRTGPGSAQATYWSRPDPVLPRPQPGRTVTATVTETAAVRQAETRTETATATETATRTATATATATVTLLPEPEPDPEPSWPRKGT